MFFLKSKIKDLTILLSCAQPIPSKIMLQNLWAQTLSRKYIARLFDHEYLWKESINVLDLFLKVVSETYFYVDLARMPLVNLGFMV